MLYYVVSKVIEKLGEGNYITEPAFIVEHKEVAESFCNKYKDYFVFDEFTTDSGK